MTRTSFVFRIAACVGLLVLLGPARLHADLTLTERVSGSMFTGSAVGMVYLTEKRISVRVGNLTVIYDLGSHREVHLDSISRKYMMTALDPDRSDVIGMIPSRDKENRKPGYEPPYRLTNTGRTTTFRGYLCRHYVIDEVSHPARKSHWRWDVLAAPGLRQPAGFQWAADLVDVYALGKIGGTPLLLTGEYDPTTTMRLEILTISKAPIPASTFAIPPGYRPGRL